MVTLSFLDHSRLFLTCSIGWLIFVIIGWSSYYQAWGFNNLLNYCIAVYFALGLVIYRMIGRYEGNKLGRSFWVAFYVTVPLIIYDYLYVTILRGEQFDLLNRFWFLSVFYLIPWIQASLLYLYITLKGYKPHQWLLLGVAFSLLAVLLDHQWATFEGNFFDMISDYPERSVTMLGSALRYTIFGSALSASILSFARYSVRGQKNS